MTTLVSIAQGGTGSNSAALARTALGVPPSAAYDQANTARDQANTARTQANSAYAQANSAYSDANTRLSASGGTLAGDLIITGNLTVSGNSTTLNTEILTVEDADIVLLSNVASTPALNAGIIVNRGTSTNTFLRWDEVTDKWGWSDDGSTTYKFNSALDAYAQANSAYGAANNRVLKAGDTMTGQLNISSGGLLVTGNVGIGTSSPGAKLQVNGGVRVASNTWIDTDNSVNLIRDTRFGYGDSYRVVQVGVAGSARAISLGYDVSTNLSGGFTGNEIVIPNNKAMIAPTSDNSAFVGVLRIDSANNLCLGGGNYQTSGHIFVNNVTGYVGIGTGSPRTVLHAVSSGAAVSTTATVGSNMHGLTLTATTNENTMTGVWFGTGSAAGTHWCGIAGARSNYTVNWSTHLAFYTHINSTTNLNDATEKMRITGEGNVGIGTDAPAGLWSGDERVLHLSSSGGTAAGIRISSVNATAEFFSSAGSIEWGLYSNSASPFTIYTNSSERLRITSGGNIGIGTTAPQSKLEVATSSGDFSHFGATSTTNGQFTGITLGYRENNSSYRKAAIVQEQIGDNSARGHLHLLVDIANDGGSVVLGDSKLMIHGTTGKVGVGTSSFNTNGGKLQVADGISFPATQSACSDANTLDDYEEGTWTPELRDAGTVLTQGYSYRSGVYHKIGRMVHIHFGFLLSSLSGTSTNALRVYGLPFTGATTGGYQEPMGYAILGNQPTAAHSNQVYFFNGTGSAYLEARLLNGVDTVYTSNNIDGDTFMKFSMIYWV
jgi:hypothetical protein